MAVGGYEFQNVAKTAPNLEIKGIAWKGEVMGYKKDGSAYYPEDYSSETKLWGILDYCGYLGYIEGVGGPSIVGSEFPILKEPPFDYVGRYGGRLNSLEVKMNV